MAVQQRAIRTRAAVLDAAAEVFAKTGYSATTLNDITAAAGVTKGAVYFHFPDKEAVANALIEDFFGQQASLLEDITAAAANPFVAVVAITYEAGERYRQDPIYRAGLRLATERALTMGELPSQVGSFITALDALLTSARRQKLLRTGTKPLPAAENITSMFFGVQHVSGMVTGHSDLPERLDDMWKMLIVSLTADPDWAVLQRQVRQARATVAAQSGP